MQISIPLAELQERDKYFRSVSLNPISFRTQLFGNDSFGDPGAGFTPLRYTFTPDNNYWIPLINITGFTMGRANAETGDNQNAVKVRAYWSFDPTPYGLDTASKADSRLLLSVVGGISEAIQNASTGQSTAVCGYSKFASFNPVGFYLEKGVPIYFFFNAQMPVVNFAGGTANNPLHEVATTLYLLPTFP